MMPMVRDVLTVVSGGEEFPGVIAYGLFRPGDRRSDGIPQLRWQDLHATDEFVLRGEAWEVVGWEFAFDAWPESAEWTSAIRATLAAHLDAGCRVAWIGAEGIPFCDPPRLFEPTCMSGGVLAWMTAEEFECPLDPDQPLVPVSDETLELLREHAKGLADVP